MIKTNTYTKKDKKRIKEINKEIDFILHNQVPKYFQDFCTGGDIRKIKAQEMFKILMDEYIELKDEKLKLKDKRWAWQKSDKNKGGIQNENR